MTLAVLAVVALSLGFGLPDRASASCAGPVLGIGPSVESNARPTPQAALRRSQRLVVSGRLFHSGCADADGSVSPGCAAPARPVATDPEAPLSDVDLVLVQGGMRWVLATATASTASTQYAITWQIVIPPAVKDGPARLEADAATLDVIIVG